MQRARMLEEMLANALRRGDCSLERAIAVAAIGENGEVQMVVEHQHAGRQTLARSILEARLRRLQAPSGCLDKPPRLVQLRVIELKDSVSNNEIRHGLWMRGGARNRRAATA